MAHGRGVRVIAERVADAFAAAAVVPAHPNPAAVVGVVEVVGVEHLLNLRQAQRAGVLGSHLVARSLDHQTQLVPRLRIEVGGRLGV